MKNYQTPEVTVTVIDLATDVIRTSLTLKNEGGQGNSVSWNDFE